MRGMTSVAFRIAKTLDLFLFCADFDVPLMRRRKRKENDGVDDAVLHVQHLRLNERGEDDDVREVVAGTRVKDAAAGDELKGWVVARPVDELVWKVGLLVHANADDREDQFLTIAQRDVDAVS